MRTTASTNSRCRSPHRERQRAWASRENRSRPAPRRCNRGIDIGDRKPERWIDSLYGAPRSFESSYLGLNLRFGFPWGLVFLGGLSALIVMIAASAIGWESSTAQLAAAVDR